MTTYRQPFKGEYPITQYYGETYTSSFHTGIDYACPIGTQILASGDGVVMFAGWDNTGYGKCVIIQHNDNKATLYAHLTGTGVVLRQKVQQGEVIGLSGSTGNSTGPHLHFEARHKWDDYKSHFNPFDLPLRSVDDSIQKPEHHDTEQTHPIVEGICEIACSAVNVRDWANLEISYVIYQGERVYVFPDVKFRNGLPFRFIGANRAIAEYDSEGTQLLKRVE